MIYIQGHKLRNLKKLGWIEVCEHGPLASGKTTRIKEKYPTHDLIQIEDQHDFERWLVRSVSNSEAGDG